MISPGLRQPIDPTLGEIPIDQLRVLVRTIADTVGKRVARKVQDSHALGAQMTSEAEKVASVTEVHAELARFNESRLRTGLPPLTDFSHEAALESVMAHIYGLGEIDVLWG